MNRFTPVKLLSLILSTLLLTSCSGPDSSGGVEFSKTDNSLPYGDCRGPGWQTHSTVMTGCGWITANERSYFIFPRVSLTNANLSNASLSNADLSFARLFGANLSKARLVYTVLYRAVLLNANLSNADLYWARLNKATLNNANLSYAYLAKTQLVGANLSSANLSNAYLGGANLTNANLVNANLSGANLATGSGMGPVLLSGAYWGSVKADSTTTCPNGIKWGTSGNDCPF
jgi:uncharacterized protein YjbI with pentapeptide repeats